MEKKNEIKTIVPVLRFPEFQEQIGWKVETLSNILDYERPDNYIVETERYCEEGIPVLTANKSFILGYTKEPTGIYVNLPVIIFDDFTTDKKYVDFPFKVKSSAIKILHTKHTNYLRFVYELMNQITFEAKEHKRYYISTYQRIQVPLPKEKEQYKIAECLSSLDDLIEAITQKVEVLKEHKKGLMQRLFPTEGKDVPDLRFPEFQGQAAEWQSTLLGAVVDYENGRAHENEIDEDGDFVVVNSKFISTDGEVVKRTNTPCCLADKEDILMVLSDVPNGRAIAKCFFVDQSGKYTVNQRICRLHSKNVNSKLLFYLINRNPYFLSFDDGVKQTNLKKSEVLECPLMIPSSPIEQQKIADLLSSIDDLIIATGQRIKSLERHKKGLMQQLFPKI